MPVTISISKPVNMGKLINELGRAGYFQTTAQIGEFIRVEDSEDDAAVNAIYDAHDPNPSAAEVAAEARKTGAKAVAQSANGWLSWTPAQMLAWVQSNIGTPLANGRTNLPATLTLASARAAFVVVLDILDKMLVMQIAMAKLLIAFLNDRWPEQ